MVGCIHNLCLFIYQYEYVVGKAESNSIRFKEIHAPLKDYLETKRIAFPRFYFVAPADLLDILSKGSDPQAILR